MQVNLRRRAIILGTIVVVLVLFILALQLLLIVDPPSAFDLSAYELTATWIKAQNATVEVFIQQTQAAMTQTPIH